MDSTIRLGAIGGIQVGVHYSWLLVFFLVAGTLAMGLFPQQVPTYGPEVHWAMGFAASLLLFASVLIHELGHSFVAEARGLKVKGITLFLFGGVSNIAGEPVDARDELLIAAVGPLTSLMLGALFWGLATALAGSLPPPVEAVVAYLSFVNVLLALFNLIPGFPLDGGRVLRAIVWWITGRLRTATRIAVGAGRVVAFLFIMGGLYVAFGGSLFSGVWLVLIGAFLNNAASAAGRQVEVEERLRGIAVRDVMDRQPPMVDSLASLSEVAQRFLRESRERALLVVDGGRLLGVVTLEGVGRHPRENWATTPARAAMATVEDLTVVDPSDSLVAAQRIMATDGLEQLPVMEDGRLVGTLGRDDIESFLQVREGLGLSGPEEERRRAA